MRRSALQIKLREPRLVVLDTRVMRWLLKPMPFTFKWEIPKFQEDLLSCLVLSLQPITLMSCSLRQKKCGMANNLCKHHLCHCHRGFQQCHNQCRSSALLAGQHQVAPSNPWKNLDKIVGFSFGSLQDFNQGRSAGNSRSPQFSGLQYNFTVKEEAFEEWIQESLPSTLVKTLRAMEQGLDKANIAILGLH
jgi:hypothetical protein